MSKISYDSETGIFTWVETKRRGFVGKKAGCFCPRDICNPDNPLTPQEQIDHINHIRTDNRIVNLRKASNTENSRNASIGSNNTSGAVGVWFEKRRNAWVAEIKVDRRKIHIGQFDTFDAAVAARKAAEVEFGFHENHGKR